jgi:hypothetical protein
VTELRETQTDSQALFIGMSLWGSVLKKVAFEPVG